MIHLECPTCRNTTGTTLGRCTLCGDAMKKLTPGLSKTRKAAAEVMKSEEVLRVFRERTG